MSAQKRAERRRRLRVISVKQSLSPRQRWNAGLNPKILAAKFTTKMAAKKAEDDQRKKRIKEIKKAMENVVIPALYEVKATFPGNSFRITKHYDGFDNKPTGVYFGISDGPVIAIFGNSGDIVIKLINFQRLRETELLSFSFDRKEKILTPSDLSRDNIFALVERIIDNT